GYGDGRALLRAGADADRHGDKARNDRKRGHQNRTQAHAVGFENRLSQGHPGGAQAVRVVHLQNSVFLHNAQKQKHPQRTPQAKRATGNPKREKREGHAQWQRQHDDERIGKAFELRREHHVHEDGGQQHGQQQIPSGFFENFHLARKKRSEEHTSELQSRENLVCRLLLEKKKKKKKKNTAKKKKK